MRLNRKNCESVSHWIWINKFVEDFKDWTNFLIFLEEKKVTHDIFII